MGPLIHERDVYLAWSLKRSKAVNGCQRVVGVMVRALPCNRTLSCVIGSIAGGQHLQGSLQHFMGARVCTPGLSAEHDKAIPYTQLV